MSYGYGYFGFDYVPVAQKRADAQNRIDKLRKKNKNIQPIAPFTDRKIAHSFWGQSWCNNMERYADYENRLPRGKSYLRHGCVCDLQISEGLVTACDMIVTANQKLVPIQAAVFHETGIAGYCASKKVDLRNAERDINGLLKSGGFYMKLQLFNDYDLFLKRVKGIRPGGEEKEKELSEKRSNFLLYSL